MERYICIHGHFYQPPRENPWLETVELQPSAYPFHDWNERVTAECYAPNGHARIVDDEQKITDIVNNYSRISFNFGPTLLTWMQENASSVYRSVLDADEESLRRFSGHGSAMAQVYNHMILPLANDDDKYTQIYWGIQDFEHRFGRKPEGLWLAETAVNFDTLDTMARLGIKFTILAPGQAARVRKAGGRNYRDVSGGRVDPTHPYLVRLRDGRSIAIFFYDGPISRAIAFEHLLNSGENFANRLAGGFTEEREWPQIMHVATDGESYGHHHKHGEMALAYALRYIKERRLATLTNYGEYLEKYPPDWEAQIVENSSWSCVHGVERWRSNCGCNSGGHGDWNQDWRGPLRHALDWLRDTLRPLCEAKTEGLLRNFCSARNEYIGVVLDRSPERRRQFFEDQAARPLSEEEQVLAMKLMEIQRHAMLMYTSCGWFFDELSGLETVQVIEYAGRAIQLARDVFGMQGSFVEHGFLNRLAAAKSNILEHRDGASIYNKWVKPAIITLEQVGAHYVISSLFDPPSTDQSLYCYDIQRHSYVTRSSGRTTLATGHIEVSSRVTQESEELSFAVLHFGDHNLSAAVRPYQSEEEFKQLADETADAFSRADIPAVIRALDRHFDGSSYSLKSLFGDEQRRIMDIILQSTLSELEGGFRTVYDHHAQLVRFLAEMGIEKPRALEMAAEFVLNASLRRAFEAEPFDIPRIDALLEQSRVERIPLDSAGLGYTASMSLKRLMRRLWKDPTDFGLLQSLIETVTLVNRLPFDVNIWRVQNIYYDLRKNIEPKFRDEEEVRRWVDSFLELGRRLHIRVDLLEQRREPLRKAS